MTVLAGKELVPRCPLPLASEMSSGSPPTAKGDEFLKYVMEKKIMEKSWVSIRSAVEKNKCVERVATYICLR